MYTYIALGGVINISKEKNNNLNSELNPGTLSLVQ